MFKVLKDDVVFLLRYTLLLKLYLSEFKRYSYYS